MAVQSNTFTLRTLKNGDQVDNPNTVLADTGNTGAEFGNYMINRIRKVIIIGRIIQRRLKFGGSI